MFISGGAGPMGLLDDFWQLDYLAAWHRALQQSLRSATLVGRCSTVVTWEDFAPRAAGDMRAL